ncbi:hypothetical protein FB566_0610 [Stackebrandtia endophytica]|uniref:YbaB/EbfC DNA-binding family protein n=1 Tax=Stackebrandtia endophytica TaxID=1496996 RepID=A0A543ARA5_9ACTN|nr:hypothetical protein [Stackebrandtia endophytica]TQL75117.1 hypothetical protein FB566_0610 [Stackebrandtia endophytica]
MSTIDESTTTGFAAKLRAVEEDLAKLRGARERMSAAAARLRKATEETPKNLTARASDDGLATVQCTDTGAVHQVELDNTGYNKVSQDQLCQAVASARSHAREAALAKAASTSTRRKQEGGFR